MAMELTPTRQEILGLLKRHGEMTVKALSEQMGITTMGVRQHLSTLEADGLLRSRLQRQKIGRPRQLFTLTEDAQELFPKGYSPLVLSILNEIDDLEGPEKVKELLRRRYKRLGDEYLKRMEGMDRDQRFSLLAEFRDKDGYMCESTVVDDGKRELVEHNCPISDVARKYPEICQFEKDLFERVLGTGLVRQQHLTDGDRACSYREAAAGEVDEALSGEAPTGVTPNGQAPAAGTAEG